ncbi:lycopene beta-cyclase CrtY [Sphingomonas sp.]|uniref:lycopene beta-cyclase CrtY n=1 Tax=Sphingomonas sp. TaxID=28214 RepID=UPI0025DF55F9|nr:lycopene beta-cyclase CrtY [Sphingomonas sp.]
MARDDRFDILILGGGLAGGLIALALARHQPALRVGIVEAAEVLGGNHVWSFFDSDIADEDRWLVEPLIAHRWPGYDVAFPAFSRGFAAGYNAIRSERLDTVVRDVLGDSVITGTVAQVRADGATLADGRTVVATAVIDARGVGDLSTLDCGWQKFMGRLLTVAGGHNVTRPVVMDATVDQTEGYRFVYLLPFDANRIFVEDTYYSDTPTLDVVALGNRIQAYAATKGWQVTATERQETGVLPVVMRGDFERYWRSTGAGTGAGVARAGARAGLFHPLTSYSLPAAVAFAAHLARGSAFDGGAIASAAHDYAARHWRSGGYYRMLTTMLFRAAEPSQRYRVLQRFYGLRPALIGRFYAGHSTILDKLRILAGRPPVSIGRAMKAIMDRRHS